MSEWVYSNGCLVNPEDLEGYVGFVYIIHNLLNDRSYIGKKLLKRSKTKQVNGKKKKIKVDSDWLTYYGSNEELKQDVATYGEEHFKRVILILCETKGLCNYYEAKLQFEHRVLERDDFYNQWIMVKVHKSHYKNYQPDVDPIKSTLDKLGEMINNVKGNKNVAKPRRSKAIHSE